MRLAIVCILFAIIGCVQVQASPAPASDSEDTGFYKNITRTIGGESFSILSYCSYTEIDCENWCLVLGQPYAILNDCESDCNDDYCNLSSEKVEFPENSGQFVTSSELIERARDEKLALLHAAHYPETPVNTHSSLQRRDLSACLLTCRTFSQFATYVPHTVPRLIANGLARLACPAICYATFAPGAAAI